MHLRQALEDALATNPDDLAAHSAYADLLMESADPADLGRGEFIQVQLNLERTGLSSADREVLESRTMGLLSEHGRAWLGTELASFLLDHRNDDMPSYYGRGRDRGKFTFARGWLDTMSIYYLSLPLAKVLADSPVLRLLSSLEIEHFDSKAGEEGTRLLAGSPHLVNLRTLELSAEENHGHSGGEGVVELIARQPRLESLVLMVHGVDTDQLFALRSLTNLKQLKVYHVTDYPLETLATNPALGRLTHLLLQPHSLRGGDESAYIHRDHVHALAGSRFLTSLTHLALRQSDLGDSGCSVIARSGILARLKELDLSRGCITDKGARLLAACPDIRHLKKLDLGNNRLTNAGIAALRATGVKLQTDQQRNPDGEEELDEGHYLLEGDWE